jgi:hypothetical protein
MYAAMESTPLPVIDCAMLMRDFVRDYSNTFISIIPERRRLRSKKCDQKVLRSRVTRLPGARSHAALIRICAVISVDKSVFR